MNDFKGNGMKNPSDLALLGLYGELRMAMREDHDLTATASRVDEERQQYVRWASEEAWDSLDRLLSEASEVAEH
jgi:hypothetical protein